MPRNLKAYYALHILVYCLNESLLLLGECQVQIRKTTASSYSNNTIIMDPDILPALQSLI